VVPLPPACRKYASSPTTSGKTCYPALREALAEYLVLSRGVRCTPEQILIISGAQIGMELSARLLANQGEVAWVEEPGYAGAHASLQAAGMDLVAAAVDEEGLNPDSVLDTRPPRLIYTTPSHQYPLGVVMSLPRRLALLAHAARCGAWILEDDYDSEFRYSSQPLPALQGLAHDERVIYIGTMSKVMYPGLRIAYMVVPDGLIDAFRRAHARLYREPPYVTQAALADFLLQGHFARHVRRRTGYRYPAARPACICWHTCRCRQTSKPWAMLRLPRAWYCARWHATIWA